MNYRLASLLSLTAFYMTAILGAFADSSFAGEPKPVVSLNLSKPLAERGGNRTLFRCEAILDNATGRDLTVRSHFNSAFDGLELVVTTKDGKILAQQSYTDHQSPVSPKERDFILKKGDTTHSLVFPIEGFPVDAKNVKVRLVGTLQGSSYARILSTETIEIKIKD